MTKELRLSCRRRGASPASARRPHPLTGSVETYRLRRSQALIRRAVTSRRLMGEGRSPARRSKTRCRRRYSNERSRPQADVSTGGYGWKAGHLRRATIRRDEPPEPSCALSDRSYSQLVRHRREQFGGIVLEVAIDHHTVLRACASRRPIDGGSVQPAAVQIGEELHRYERRVAWELQGARTPSLAHRLTPRRRKRAPPIAAVSRARRALMALRRAPGLHQVGSRNRPPSGAHRQTRIRAPRHAASTL